MIRIDVEDDNIDDKKSGILPYFGVNSDEGIKQKEERKNCSLTKTCF